MKKIKVDLEPFERGFEANRTVTFRAPTGKSLPFPSLKSAKRLYAQFRIDPNQSGAPDATVDSDLGTITAITSGQLSFTLSASQTDAFPTTAKVVYVDFLMQDQSDRWIPLPARFAWPISNTISKPPV